VDKEQRLAIVKEAARVLIHVVNWSTGTYKHEGYVYQKTFKDGERMTRIIFDDYPSFVDIKPTGESITPCCVICRGQLGGFGYIDGDLRFSGWYKNEATEMATGDKCGDCLKGNKLKVAERYAYCKQKEKFVLNIDRACEEFTEKGGEV